MTFNQIDICIGTTRHGTARHEKERWSSAVSVGP